MDMNLSWENDESLLLVNPRYAASEQRRFQAILTAAGDWPGHLWLSTSGSSAPKWVGLSKRAVLSSAEAVNRHLQSSKEDCWIHTLPSFHVGGLGILARAYLSGATVCDFRMLHAKKWDPEAFYVFVREHRGTLTSLVPAQLYDLTLLRWRAPASLRAVIIGGGALSPPAYERAIALGWPVLPSYGSTECASQIATATLESWTQQKNPSLQLLPHIRAKEQEGCLAFSGPSLLSVYAYLKGDGEVRFVDPKCEGWWVSEDRGGIRDGEVELWGRTDAVVKVGGESVDLARLERILQSLRVEMGVEAESVLVSLPDPRMGTLIHLVSECPNKVVLEALVDKFQRSVLPFERIRRVVCIEAIPRSSIGKILMSELVRQIKNLGIQPMKTGS